MQTSQVLPHQTGKTISQTAATKLEASYYLKKIVYIISLFVEALSCVQAETGAARESTAHSFIQMKPLQWRSVGADAE